MIVSDDALNNGTHKPSAELPLKTEETSTEAMPELSSAELSKPISSIEKPTLTDTPPLIEVPAKEENMEEADNSTNSALNDSVMAVYGGKDETFMENSTLEQSVDMTTDQTNDNLANNSTSNSSNVDVKESISSPRESMEASSAGNKTTPLTEPESAGTSAQETPVSKTDDLTNNTGVETSETGVVKSEVNMETLETEEAQASQGAASPVKEKSTDDKTDRGSKRQRDR